MTQPDYLSDLFTHPHESQYEEDYPLPGIYDAEDDALIDDGAYEDEEN